MPFRISGLRPTRAVGNAGFNLVEAAIVLGIVGLIIAGIWTAASAVYENMRISRATQQLLSVAQNIRSLYSSQFTMGGTAGDDLTAGMVTARVFPGDMTPDLTTDPDSPWGTDDVEVYAAGSGATTDGFRIVYKGIPTNACIDLSVRNSGQSRDIGLTAVSAGTGSSATPGNAIATLPATVTTASAACGTGATASVSFTFNLRG